MFPVGNILIWISYCPTVRIYAMFKMIISRVSLLPILFAIQFIWPSSGAENGIRSRSDIIATLLAVRSYEMGRNITSTPLSAGKIRAAKRYLNNWYFESRLNLDLAEVEAELLATTEARKFLNKACNYGLPSYDNLLYRDNFILSYDNRLKQPVWSLEYLPNKKAMDREACKGKSRWFNLDKSIHINFRTLNEDYRGSGYHRGHFAPACNNRCSKIAFEQSYRFSNIAPQVKNLNFGSCGLWSRLERYSFYVARRSKNTYIITGALLLAENGSLFPKRRDPGERISYRVISANRIAVPTHFYKVMLSESFDKKFLLEAFMIPNSHGIDRFELIETFRIDVDTELPQLEKLTGLKFFEILNKLRIETPIKLLYNFDDNPSGYKTRNMPETVFPHSLYANGYRCD